MRQRLVRGVTRERNSRSLGGAGWPSPTGRRRMWRHISPFTAGLVSLLTGVGLAATPVGGAAMASASPHASATADIKPTVVYPSLPLPGGDTATVYSNGLAEIFSRSRSAVQYRVLPPSEMVPSASGTSLPSKSALTWDLSKAPVRPYVAGDVEVVLTSSVSATKPALTLSAADTKRLHQATSHPGAVPSTQLPAYTTSQGLNNVLGRLGVDHMAQIFSGASLKAAGVSTPASQGTDQSLDMAHSYVIHVTNQAMPAALQALLASPDVTYAEPDWTVSPLDTTATALPAAARPAAASAATPAAASPAQRAGIGTATASGQPGLPALPTNYALQTSAQALLNKPGINWVPAYEAIESKYQQLPGNGEIITDVSLGDLDSTGIPASDPCYGYVSAYGPTTVVQNGQRYLDWPSLPLIPTYTASSSATLDPTGETCGVDPYDAEIGLDFAMMAPLPHGLQRPDAIGAGLTDLLGIAPGAQYRLVVPSDPTASITSVDAAFLAAAQQTPRPNVITASLGFGLDSEGFPSRYLEDDPLTAQLVSTLVHQDHIIVSISANDGLRAATNAAIAPTGGSAATDMASASNPPTNLNDIQFSTAPSVDPDTGSIDVGGVTLDDIFAAQPQNPASGSLSAQHAFPELRWDGSSNFSSGYGSRVNISAPADNVIGLEHPFGGTASTASPDDIGGTSASSQEVGAAAAVVQQVARLSGKSSIAANPVALRSYLERTASAVPAVPQAAGSVSVGPQVDLGAAVNGLIRGAVLAPGVARVAVEQRQSLAAPYLDTLFLTATAPGTVSMSGANQNALVTISPDWVGLPAGQISYRLTALDSSRGANVPLGTGPWARLQPDAILAAAGDQPSAQTSQTVDLTYTASKAGQTVAQVTFPVAFTAATGVPQPLAPAAPAVVTGNTIKVSYHVPATGTTNPVLVVSEPGRPLPLYYPVNLFHPSYSVPLTAPSGTVDVPVADLPGGGIYGIGIDLNDGTGDQAVYSDFAVTRVQGAATDIQSPAPLLSAPGSPPGHLLTIPYRGSFTVSWDVSHVPGASGAMLEISAAGPNAYGSYNTIDNPGGTVKDANGQDTGSIYFAPLPGGPAGHATLSAAETGLVPAMYHDVRVIPVAHNGKAVGEGSQESILTMNGIAAADGGYVNNGFDVNSAGSDGLLTSDQQLASGQILSSVETFSQATGQITQPVASESSGSIFSTVGPALFANDAGLYANNSPDGTTSYGVLSTAANGTAGQPWTPPTPTITQAAVNQTAGTTAILSGTFGKAGNYSVFTSNIGADTFGPAINVEAPISGFSYPDYTGFAEDPATNTAVLAGSDFGKPLCNSSPTLVTVNLTTGSVSSFPGSGAGESSGLAVDPRTDTAVVPTFCDSGVEMYDLATGAMTAKATLPTAVNEFGDGVFPVVDSVNGLAIVDQPVPPDLEINNNALSRAYVINEHGTIVETLSKFNFFGQFLGFHETGLAINPATRTAYGLGPNGQDIQPFAY